MSQTLFWYIFRDLVRIFLLAVGALSAIMSFGGLLKPLYEFGLNIDQVGQILTWSTPAMWAYSLPIGALFATTIVYGRLGADNEITACRAAGFSHLALTLPAFVLGLVTAIISLALLCFVVPYSTLKVEKILYSNIAALVAGQIERSHQIRLPQDDRPITVFAQAARVLDADPNRPHDQAVQLIAPLIVQYEDTRKGDPLVPQVFYMARSATAYIRQDYEDDEVTMDAALIDGMSIPRTAATDAQGGIQVAVHTQRVGPIPLRSPVRENTKFMDIFRLQSLLNYPEQSQRIRSLLARFIRRDQQQQFLEQLLAELTGPSRSVTLAGGMESYLLQRGDAPVELRRDRLIIGPAPEGQPVRLIQTRGTQTPIEVDAAEIRLRAFPDTTRQRIELDIEFLGSVTKVGDDITPRGNWSRPISIEMPTSIAALTSRPASDYVNGSLSDDDKNRLLRDLKKQHNSVISELHARTSFAVSCLILVMVGCALGMMFRSGNFLSAFAVSVIPALLCIALVVTGQHTCENVPSPMPKDWTDPLQFGLILIWSGNAAVLAIAAFLLTRLQRQ